MRQPNEPRTSVSVSWSISKYTSPPAPSRSRLVKAVPTGYNNPVKRLRIILGFLLFVCCTLWVASYWGIRWVSFDGLLVLDIQNGSFTIGIFEYDVRFPYGLTVAGYAGLHTDWWPVVWVYNKSVWWVLLGTFWLPTLLLALPVAHSVRPWTRLRRRRRAKQGLCIRCGYDLSGADHETCPECGKEIRKRKPA